MASAVNTGARLDRLPISSFHYRVFWLIGAGMFFDGYDLYVAGGVLAATIQSKFSTLPQNLHQLIICRFVQGLGLGAEIVVGYSTMTEFVPPRTRGRWLAFMAFIVVAGFPVTSLLGYLVIPTWGWRPVRYALA